MYVNVAGGGGVNEISLQNQGCVEFGGHFEIENLVLQLFLGKWG